MNSLFSTIVVGVDDSEASKHAVSLAARLAREHDGRLILCNSVNWIPLVAQIESAGAIDPSPLIEGMKAQGDALLSDACEAVKQLGVVAQRRTLEGEPADSLIRLAQEEHAGVIVMGTHGRRGLGRLVIGSTTETVLRASEVPVLTVRENAKTPDPAHRCFERIFVAIDDSEPSDAAVATVLNLPAEDRRHVTFTSVADPERVIGSRGYFHYATIRRALRERAQCIVDQALDSARTRHVDAQARVIEGTTDDAILAAAIEDNADLLVMGSHGRRGLQRFFLGSVAERIVRSAPVPVLVVRTAASVSASVPQKHEELVHV